MERRVELAKAFFSDQSGILFTVFFICTIALVALGFALNWISWMPLVAGSGLLVLSSLWLGRVLRMLDIQIKDLAASFIAGNLVSVIAGEAVFYALSNTISINIIGYVLTFSFTLLMFSGWGSRIEGGIFKRGEDGLLRFEKFEK